MALIVMGILKVRLLMVGMRMMFVGLKLGIIISSPIISVGCIYHSLISVGKSEKYGILIGVVINSVNDGSGGYVGRDMNVGSSNDGWGS